MHELAAIGTLIEAVVGVLASHRPARVEAVRIRRGSSFSAEALRKGFELLSRGTPLDGAKLVVEVVEATADCQCGRRRAITADDLIGHMYVCDVCGAVQDLAGATDLELIDIAVSPAPSGGQ